MTSFNDFGLSEPILQAIEKSGYDKPTPIQEKTLPLILERKDVIGLAQTGSGKTAACAIPICDRVNTENRSIQALIVVPTRELALQYAMEAQKIGKIKGVSVFPIYGGESQDLQLAKMKHSLQVCIATPGRLVDFIFQRVIDLSHVSTLVLDEADKMLSMGFVEDIETIIQCLVHEHQTLLFSATMPEGIRRLAENYMKTPETIRLQQKQASPEGIHHCFTYCHPRDKKERLCKLLKGFPEGQGMIFCGSRKSVEEIAKTLQKEVEGVDFLHAGLAQNVRNQVLRKFQTGKIRILVATDVAARGLDFSAVTGVFLYDLGKDIDTYLHRAGRTGRMDREGLVLSFITKKDLPTFTKIEKRLSGKIEWLGAPPRT